jgi:methylmalonyl-CoA mutase N-terminal domain/subunit
MPLEEAARGCGGVSFRMSMDIIEEACKLRAARLMWTQLLERRYGITNPKVANLRIHCVTAGSMMTWQQPLNNIVRGTLMALAGVLGGVQSLGVSGYDEALSIPSEHAHQMSVRIQQILQNETNLASVTDPLGGSYYVETLTAQLVERAWQFFEEIEQQGGFLATLDSGWLHARAAENQHAEFMAQDSGERVIVGVTDHREDISPYAVDGFMGVDDAFDVAIARLEEVRRTRGERRAGDALRELEGEPAPRALKERVHADEVRRRRQRRDERVARGDGRGGASARAATRAAKPGQRGAGAGGWHAGDKFARDCGGGFGQGGAGGWA